MKLRTKSTRGYVDVPRSSFYEVTFEFEAGSLISWEFKTQYYDIGFAVYYFGKAKVGEKKEVVSMVRHEAFKQVITGTFEVKEKGFYQFYWDNTFSWTRGKSIKFNVYNGSELL